VSIALLQKIPSSVVRVKSAPVAQVPRLGMVAITDPNVRDEYCAHQPVEVHTLTGERHRVFGFELKLALTAQGPSPDPMALHADPRGAFAQRMEENPGDLPRLPRDRGYAVLEDADSRFNCFAWASRSRSTRPEPYSLYDVEEHYNEKGFLAVDGRDLHPCPGFEKLAVFTVTPRQARTQLDTLRNQPDAPTPSTLQYLYEAIECGEAVPVHAAVQETDGSFTSKMGRDELIQVRDLNLLGGGLFGEPELVMLRPQPKGAGSDS
jgi:hypothetical protein